MNPSSPAEIRQRSLSSLREGYSRGMRRFEIGSIAVCSVAMLWLVVRIAPAAAHAPWLVLTAIMLGYVVADLVSGLVHWAADTWGTPDVPVVGKALIRPFREHHVDQKEITRHDFVETNGNNCFICIVPVALASLLPMRSTLGLFGAALVLSMCFFVLCTNQFHKWAHLDAPPPLIDWMQRMHVILPRDHHAVHHTAPYAKYYCITVGWLNEALYRVRFFQTLERLITATTGALPREDDIGKHAALVVARGLPPELPRIELSQEISTRASLAKS